MRNPPWTRDELILALELYFQGPNAHGNATEAQVIELSDILNRLPLHPPSERENAFRNPNGVRMKLSNFLRFDPNHEGVGLARGNRLEEEVWKNFSGDREKLADVASLIRASAESTITHDPTEGDSEDEASEGKILTRMHKRRERNSGIVKKKKRSVLESEGALRCEACGFDFKEAYGELGAGFAECHHLVPLADLKSGSVTRLSDLAILCANCHRMIHRQGGLSIEELQSHLAE